MVKGIVFDMDGLMFDSERLAKQAWINAGASMGYSIPEDLLVKTIGLNIEKTRQVMMEHFGDNFDFKALRKMRVDYVTEYIEKNGIPIKNGLVDLLDYLSANKYRITVATSSEKERAQYCFDKSNVSQYFDDFVSGDMIKKGKPEPDIYIKACEIIGVDPNECMALEDSPAGILSAYRAGLKTVMIPDLVKPDEETRKILFAELPTLNHGIELLKSM